MHVLSLTHTVVAPSSAAVLLNGLGSLPKINAYYHPPRTVLDLDDTEAKRLVGLGLVVRYDRTLHGEYPLSHVPPRQSPAAS